MRPWFVLRGTRRESRGFTQKVEHVSHSLICAVSSTLILFIRVGHRIERLEAIHQPYLTYLLFGAAPKPFSPFSSLFSSISCPSPTQSKLGLLISMCVLGTQIRRAFPLYMLYFRLTSCNAINLTNSSCSSFLSTPELSFGTNAACIRNLVV